MKISIDLDNKGQISQMNLSNTSSGIPRLRNYKIKLEKGSISSKDTYSLELPVCDELVGAQIGGNKIAPTIIKTENSRNGLLREIEFSLESISTEAEFQLFIKEF